MKLSYKITTTLQIQFCNAIWFVTFLCCVLLNNTSTFVFLFLTHDATRLTVGNVVLSSCVVLLTVVRHLVNNIIRWQHIILVNLSIFLKHIRIWHLVSLKRLYFLQKYQ